MTGLFVKKYHIAVYDENEEFVNKIIATLKLWYNNKIVVESYTDSTSMFEAVNTSNAINKPFDLAIFSKNEIAEKLVLKHTCPSLPVLLCSDEKMLKLETSKLLL